ncbi:MAG: hypothetical protein OEZ58_22585, partial [Gammaproteobacteria bacterium]|nr:hypothetical protein [Gammaproteobacteria bacterium]
MQQHRSITLLILAIFIITLISACSDNIQAPSLSGPWQAGTTVFEVSDQAHWTQIRAWYPSTDNNGAKLLSSDEYSLTALANSISMPRFLMGDEEYSRSAINSPIAEGRFPVIIFNHGLMSYERQNTTQFEQLASHGYVVLSVANPGYSMVVVRDEKNVFYVDETSAAYQALQRQKDGAKQLAPQLKKDIELAKQAENFEIYQQRMRVLANNPVFSPMEPVFKAVYDNNALLLKSLTDLQNGSLPTLLSGHMDLNNIGAYGHSFGAIMSGILA